MPTFPELTQPVNDFAHVIDAPSAAAMDRMIRALQAATGDVVVVATVPTIEPYGDIREYANKLFENHGRGIGQKGKNNGLLILLAVKERKVWIEVGYDLEQWITDGFAGETSRLYMVPEFREGRYGDGLRIGTERVIGRIAQGRNVTLQGVRAGRERAAAAIDPGRLHSDRFHHPPRGQPHRRRPARRRRQLGPPRVERLVERRRSVRRRLGLGAGWGAAVSAAASAVLAADRAAAAVAAGVGNSGNLQFTMRIQRDRHAHDTQNRSAVRRARRRGAAADGLLL